MLERDQYFADRKHAFVSAKCTRYCQKKATLKDETGRMWCEDCRKRYELIQWGHEHKYPELAKHPYAVGEGQDLWLVCVLIGTDEYVATMLEAAREVA